VGGLGRGDGGRQGTLRAVVPMARGVSLRGAVPCYSTGPR
jgi:hypothetical protein